MGLPLLSSFYDNFQDGRVNSERVTTHGATRLRTQPPVDALGVVAMVAPGQDLHLLSVLEHSKADTALRLRRLRVVGDHRKPLDGGGVESLRRRRIRIRRRRANAAVAAGPAGVEEEEADDEENGEYDDDEEERLSPDFEAPVVQDCVVPLRIVRPHVSERHRHGGGQLLQLKYVSIHLYVCACVHIYTHI